MQFFGIHEKLHFACLSLLRICDTMNGVETVPESLLAHSLPTPTEAKEAKEASRVLSSRLRSKSPLRFRVVGVPQMRRSPSPLPL